MYNIIKNQAPVVVTDTLGPPVLLATSTLGHGYSWPPVFLASMAAQGFWNAMSSNSVFWWTQAASKELSPNSSRLAQQQQTGSTTAARPNSNRPAQQQQTPTSIHEYHLYMLCHFFHSYQKLTVQYTLAKTNFFYTKYIICLHVCMSVVNAVFVNVYIFLLM